MPKSLLAVSRPVASGHARKSLILPLFTASVVLAAGVYSLRQHLLVGDVQQILAAAGIVLLLSALTQCRLVLVAWRAGRLAITHDALGVLKTWRLYLAGAFVAYLAGLAIGPVPYIGWAWLAAVAAWHTILLLPLAASQPVVETWRRWTQGRSQRRLTWLVAVAILLVVVVEAGLQTHRWTAERGWFSTAITSSTPAAPVHTIAMRPDDADASASFRVAVVGEPSLLRATQTDGYLTRVQQMLPGLKLLPLESSASTRPNAEFKTRLEDYRPDLVLIVLSVCADLTHTQPAKNWFDWRQLELARCFGAANRAACTNADFQATSEAEDFEAFLRSLSPQMAACRTPIDDTMRARWQRTLDQLDALRETCDARQLPVALVLIPGEFQVNRTLCATLARRMGSTTEQFDLELPQRRLAGFADHRRLPVLDLLPHLRLCRQSPYEPNAQRWNEQGHAAAAGALSGWLESRFGSQLASAAQLSSAP